MLLLGASSPPLTGPCRSHRELSHVQPLHILLLTDGVAALLKRSMPDCFMSSHAIARRFFAPPDRPLQAAEA